VLAAGGSLRLDRPKQLVRHQGRTLLERTISAAVGAGADPIVVVLGASADAIERELPSFSNSVRIARNPQWADGMGTSIACGVRALLETDPAAQAVLILVCDQPALSAEVLKGFVDLASAEPAKIIIADFGSGRGPPVVFPRARFEELLALRGDIGAREIHRKYPDDVRMLAFPGGAIDIDTPGDLDCTES